MDEHSWSEMRSLCEEELLVKCYSLIATNDERISCLPTLLIDINAIVVDMDVNAHTILFCVCFPLVGSAAIAIDYYLEPFASVFAEGFRILSTTFGGKGKSVVYY